VSTATIAHELRTADLEPDVQLIGARLASAMPAMGRLSPAAAEQRLVAALMGRSALRAALFRFIDVRPACRGDADLGRHLVELLSEAETTTPARLLGKLVRRPRTQFVVARAAAARGQRAARRFIVGRDPVAALPAIEDLWNRGVATSVDLLGEATVTEAEADHYAARCDEALRVLHAAASRWPPRAALERDSTGALSRVNLSVKVSALTPLVRPAAPTRAIRGAEGRLRALLRTARDVGAHLHVDMESMDGREAVLGLTQKVLSEDEFAEGPSAGVVLQAYLTDSPEHLEEILDWSASIRRATPLSIRLVKGAYWDQEVVQAAQKGWRAPVFTDRGECHRNFERLTRRLLDATPAVRPAIASHNIRSVAHAIAYARHRGLGDQDVEFQVLRGLGDDTQEALASLGHRVRTYCPVGDLVAGMAYLVRRLLENTSNDSFLGAYAHGLPLDELLAAP
jgi:proline dehydrogenase